MMHYEFQQRNLVFLNRFQNNATFHGIKGTLQQQIFLEQTAICKERLMFCIVRQVISSLPMSCQKITKLNEIDIMEMTALSC